MMKRQLLKVTNTRIAISLIFIFLYSCNPAYIPNMLNVPLHNKEKELKTNLAVSISGFDPQLSYSINSKTAIMFNGNLLFQKGEDENGVENNEYHRQLFGEIAIGRFSSSHKNLRAEFFGGFGAGKVKDYTYESNLLNTPVVDAFIKRLFIQGNVGISSEVIDIGFANRLSFVNIDFNTPDLNNGKFDPYWEPALILKLGYKNVKAFTQLGISAPLFDYEKNYDHLGFIFGFGLQINLQMK